MNYTKGDDLIRQSRAARAAAEKARSDTAEIEVKARHLRGLLEMQREARGGKPFRFSWLDLIPHPDRPAD